MKSPVKQSLLIAVLVLVPFAALIGWGLWPSAEQPGPGPVSDAIVHPAAVPPGDSARVPEQGHAPLTDQAPSALSPGPPAVEPAQLEPADAAPAPVALSPAHQAALAAVTPLVDKCLDEHRVELTGKVQLRIGFWVQPTGAMKRPHVKMAPLDPYLQACLEDLFEETTLDVSNGVPEGQVQGSFDFDPAQERR